MRTVFTFRKLAFLFTFLLFAFSLQAQYCPGVNAQITNKPINNLCDGSSITLTAETNAAYTSYVWQKQTTAGGPFLSIAGATSSSYTTTAIGAYRVLVGNGTCRDTSSIVSVIHLQVEGGTISGGPSGPICPNSSGGQLTGIPSLGNELGILTYQWQLKVGATGSWNDIQGATGLSYSTQLIPSTTSFRRAVKDNCGNAAYSNEITITTSTAINPGSIAPATQSNTTGSTPATLTSVTGASGGNGALSYKWQYSADTLGVFADIPGATGASYSPGPQNYTIYFRRITTDAICKNSIATRPVEVLVTNQVELKAGDIVSRYSCFFPGKVSSSITTRIPVSGGIAPYTMQWESSIDNSTWTIITGASGNTYEPGVLTQTTWFRKKVTDAAGTVRYAGPIVIKLQAGNLNPGSIEATANVACIGSSPGKIFSTASASNFGEVIDYKWQTKTETTEWADADAPPIGDIYPAPISEKTFFRRVTTDGCGVERRTAASNEVAIDIRPALFAGDIDPASQMIPQNGTPMLLRSTTDPFGGTGSNTVWWEKSTLAVGPWTTIPGATSLTYQSPALDKTNYFRRAVKDNNCLALKYTYIVEVYVSDAAPLKPGTLVGATCVFPGNLPAEIQQGGIVEGGVPPYTYSWERRNDTSGPWTVIPGATGKFYQPPVLTETTQFRRKATDAVGTSGYTPEFTINYLSTPIAPGTIGVVGNNMICAGTASPKIMSTAAASNFGEYAEYKWQMHTEGGAWIDIPGAIQGDYTPGVLTQKTYFRRGISDKCSGVSRTEYSNEVFIDIMVGGKFKEGLVDAPFITCAGSAPGTIKSVLEACGSGNVKYQWEMNDGTGWKTITGATGPSYTPGAITVETQFRRKATDACGNTGYSNTELIRTYPPIEPGIIGTASQTVCSNVAPTKIGLLTNCHYTDGTVTYQWEKSATGTGAWSSVGGATGFEYQPATSTADAYYRLKVMSTTCSAIAYTNIAKVAVQPVCTPTISGTAASFCSSSQAPVNVSTSTTCANAAFEWQYTSGAATPTSVWTGTGNTTATLNARSYFTTAAKMSFRLKASNTTCNLATYSNVVSVEQNLGCRSAASTSSVEVFPNPTAAGRELTVKTNLEGKNKVTLKTVQGKSIDVTVLSSTSGVIKIKLPGQLSSGTYFLHIMNEKGGQVIEKVVLEN